MSRNRNTSSNHRNYNQWVTVQYNVKSHKIFCASYSLFCFSLFLQWNNFLIHQYFSIWILDLCFLLPYVFLRNYIFILYSSIFLIKPRICNISIDCSSLKIFSSLLSHLQQIIERTNVLSKIHDILGLLKF